MSISIKVLAAIGVVSLIPAGVLIAKNTGKQDLSFESLANEDNSDYEGKYASSFKHHFMNAINSNKRGWWEESYKRLEKERNNLSVAFKKANKGYGTEATALNQICLEAYTSDKSSLEADRRRDVWNYCSVEQKQPNLKTPDSGDLALKIKQEKGDILIDSEDGKNKEFWDNQQKVFTGNNDLTKSIDQNSKFHSYRGAYADKTIREICKDAYSWNDNESDRKEIIKFCSITG